MAQHTNSDIFKAVMDLTTEVSAVKEIAKATKAQAEKTNGRVTKIEEWKNALIAVDQYKKENPAQTQTINAPNATTVTIQPKWFQNEKLVGGVVAVLIALAGVVSYVASSLGTAGMP